MDPGETRQVDFTDFGFASISDILEEAADPSDHPFENGSCAVVDLLGEITVGTPPFDEE